jgi:hypothetical protein
MLVPNLHWIIIEDAEDPSSLVANLLKNSGITYTHLTATTPKEWKLKEKVCLLYIFLENMLCWLGRTTERQKANY